MATSRQTLGLAALAATSTIGVWLIYNQFRDNRKEKKEQHFLESGAGLFDSLTKSSNNPKNLEHKDSTSSLDSSELEQIWTTDGEVDLKICRQLLLQRKHSKSRKVALFSHLLAKLEQTLDERDRIEYKLNHIRDAGNGQGAQRPKVTTLPNQRGPPSVPIHSDTSVCMVVQRYRVATIMGNNSEYIQVGKTNASLTSEGLVDSVCGLMVYVSFAKGCTQQTVMTAAKIIVNLPILTTGAWGDGVSKTMNVIDLAMLRSNSASIVIVPQANLINKVCFRDACSLTLMPIV